MSLTTVSSVSFDVRTTDGPNMIAKFFGSIKLVSQLRLTKFKCRIKCFNVSEECGGNRPISIFSSVNLYK